MALPREYQATVDRFVKKHGTIKTKEVIAGFKEYEEMVKAYVKHVENEEEKAFWESGQMLERQSKRNAPVETGLTGASITHEVDKSGSTLTGAWGTNVKTAIWIEFGTVHITVGTPERPRETWAAKRKTGTTSPETMPFIRPAWLMLKDRIIRKLQKAAMWKYKQWRRV